jgi:hypothetical protein
MKRGCGLLAALAVVLASSIARAQSEPAASPPTTSTDDDQRRAAHDAYEAGKTAFEAHDYLRAGDLFLEAYGRAPHYDPLWNAARSFDLGGESARAANLYSRYLALAPATARDRDRATAARKDLASKLGRLDLQERGVTDLTVDGTAPEMSIVYVDAGKHVITARHGADQIRIVQNVDAGSAVSVVVEPPPPPHTAAAAPRSRGIRVLPPIVVVIGSAVALAGVGVTIGSGLDTVNTKHAYERTPTQGLYDDGQSKETRTNVFFWSTIGVGALTGIAAIFLVDWGAHANAARVGFGPTSLRIEGTF